MNFRWLVCLVLIAPLAGCLSVTDNKLHFTEGVRADPTLRYDCNPKQGEVAKKADWKKAEVVEEEIRDDIYQSGLITMWKDKPYIIRVTNNDDGVRSFNAHALFMASSVLKAVYDGEDAETPCLQNVAIGPGKTAEIHLVPLQSGGYDYHETTLFVGVLTEFTTNGAVGFAYVY